MEIAEKKQTPSPYFDDILVVRIFFSKNPNFFASVSRLPHF